MRAIATLLLLTCLVPTVDADVLTIPEIEEYLAVLYAERDALEQKAKGQGWTLDDQDRQRYIEVLTHIEALEDLLQIYGRWRTTICHDSLTSPTISEETTTERIRAVSGRL